MTFTRKITTALVAAFSKKTSKKASKDTASNISSVYTAESYDDVTRTNQQQPAYLGRMPVEQMIRELKAARIIDEEPQAAGVSTCINVGTDVVAELPRVEDLNITHSMYLGRQSRAKMVANLIAAGVVDVPSMTPSGSDADIPLFETMLDIPDEEELDLPSPPVRVQAATFAIPKAKFPTPVDISSALLLNIDVNLKIDLSLSSSALNHASGIADLQEMAKDAMDHQLTRNHSAGSSTLVDQALGEMTRTWSMDSEDWDIVKNAVKQSGSKFKAALRRVGGTLKRRAAI